MTIGLALALALGVLALTPGDSHDDVSIEAAQEDFYNGRYAEAAELAQTLVATQPTPEVYELRTAILHFQLRRALGEPRDREKALKACTECADYLHAFMEDYRAGQAVAREALRQQPGDAPTLFYLGKLDLNYVWLVLGTLGRRTGWNEYWEARRSLDAALTLQPDHVRARVARAWIDYIVDAKTPWGTGWVLGGGSRKKALTEMRAAAVADSDYYTRAEALFGLWDMQVRERRTTEAMDTARQLNALFPDNADVERFVNAQTR